jgi:hypothetical protein
MRMLAHALDAGVPAGWVAADEVYGANPALRAEAELEARGVGYVLAVACDHRVVCGGDSYRADALLRLVPARAWQCLSAGKGAKGHRLYDWAFIRLDHHQQHGPAVSDGGQTAQRWLLIRRNQRTGDLAFYRCWMPRPVPLAILVRGRRDQVDGGGALSDRQGAGRPGPASGPPLALLVPLGHPCHARPCLPGGGCPGRTYPPAATVGADRVDLQRGPASVRGPGPSAGRWSCPSAALVAVAAPTSGPSPYLPRPKTSHPTVKITIGGWSIGKLMRCARPDAGPVLEQVMAPLVAHRGLLDGCAPRLLHGDFGPTACSATGASPPSWTGRRPRAGRRS